MRLSAPSVDALIQYTHCKDISHNVPDLLIFYIYSLLFFFVAFLLLFHILFFFFYILPYHINQSVYFISAFQPGDFRSTVCLAANLNSVHTYIFLEDGEAKLPFIWP